MYKVKLGEIEFNADIGSPNRQLVEFVTGYRSDAIANLYSEGATVDVSLQEVGSSEARTGRGKLTAWDVGVGGAIAFE